MSGGSKNKQHSGQESSDAEILQGLQVGTEVEEDLAYAVILVDLASVDGKFEQRERLVIRSALNEVFGCSPEKAKQLIKQAQDVVSTHRGSQMFIEAIRQEYSYAEKAKLLEIIDRVISSDDKQDDTEIYMRTKFAKLLS